MREGEWGNPDRIGKERPTQPKDCGEMTAKEQEALRIRMLEGEGFAYWFEDALVDGMTRQIAGVIGYHIGMRNDADLGRYMRETFGPAVEKLLRQMEDGEK